MSVPLKIKEIARRLRNNMTESEVIIWNGIKNNKLGVKFLRQKPILVYKEDNGFSRYIIPDFYCYENKLILEIDGSIHNLKEIYKLDRYKEELLILNGYNIIRFTNDEIKYSLNYCITKLKGLIK